MCINVIYVLRSSTEDWFADLRQFAGFAVQRFVHGLLTEFAAYGASG